MSDPLPVVGVGADGWDGLSPTARRAISDAEVLMGSPRQLALVPDGLAEKVPWPSPLLTSLPGLLERHAESRVCVLASGDPMFHGIGVTLARLLGPNRIRVIPAPSSASLACARLGWPLADTPIVSLVNRPVETLLPALQDGVRVLVLSNDESTPGSIADLLCANGYGGSTLTVLEQLGGPAEARTSGTAREWPATSGDSLNVVALVCVTDDASVRLTRMPGLPDQVFGGAGQLTKQEVRALTLCALAPAPGELLWDVGGGSGSIAIEWSRTHPNCRAVAFESIPMRAAQIAENARTLGVPTVTVLGAAPAAFADAGDPQAVFIGGGLTEDGMFDACWNRLSTGGRLVANSVTAESEALLVHLAAKHGGTLRRFQIHRAEPLGRFTAWRPQLPVTQYSVVHP